MTKDISVQPVILCGGSGHRLWPLSRSGFPKQFMSFDKSESLFQQAALRLNGLTNETMKAQDLLIVTGEEHRFLALEQLKEIDVNLKAALLEPEGRNTAPALTLAALAAIETGEDPVMVVTPADHFVDDAAAYQACIKAAVWQAAQGGVTILGVAPDKPETGYGYIQVARTATNVTAPNVEPVLRFVEKPDQETAKAYLSSGDYYWNAGIFVLKASIWLEALKKFRLDIFEASHLAWEDRNKEKNISAKFVRFPKDKIHKIPSESIDYAVLENCSEHETFSVHMVTMNAGWSDMGSWDAVWQQLKKDADGNVSSGDTLVQDCQNTLVHSSSRLVTALGVENLVIIESPDAVMVVDRECSQNVKHIVNELRQHKRDEQILHRKVFRPWGWYDGLDEGAGFKVKRIRVKPGACLSLQKHYHRAEHWVVVKGTAQITVGEKDLMLTENQSTYIPIGEVHRLSNPGTISLEIIEVQSGRYLGEDDIVRLEDVYGRDANG